MEGDAEAFSSGSVTSSSVIKYGDNEGIQIRDSYGTTTLDNSSQTVNQHQPMFFFCKQLNVTLYSPQGAEHSPEWPIVVPSPYDYAIGVSYSPDDTPHDLQGGYIVDGSREDAESYRTEDYKPMPLGHATRKQDNKRKGKGTQGKKRSKGSPSVSRTPPSDCDGLLLACEWHRPKDLACLYSRCPGRRVKARTDATTEDASESSKGSVEEGIDFTANDVMHAQPHLDDSYVSSHNAAPDDELKLRLATPNEHEYQEVAGN